jgi:uncharacterized protein
MSKLQQRQTSGERKVSALRQRLKHPGTYLAVLFLLMVLALLDTFRSPAHQVTGWLYTRGVHGYQVFARPLLKGRIQCRYYPTCSNYSIEAVQKHGIRHGLSLTFRRIHSCQTQVVMGTLDPVPPAI